MQALTELLCPSRTFTRQVVRPTLPAMTFATHIRPIHEIRWANFRALLTERGLTITAAAERLSKPQGQVSHFGGKNPTKVIGDQIAGEIEAAFGLPPGALDKPDSSQNLTHARIEQAQTLSQILMSDAPMLAEAEKWVRFEEGAGARFQPVRRAERLITLYEAIKADGGTMAPERAESIIQAAREKAGGHERSTVDRSTTGAA
jgi:hypothetical protein